MVIKLIFAALAITAVTLPVSIGAFVEPNDTDPILSNQDGWATHPLGAEDSATHAEQIPLSESQLALPTSGQQKSGTPPFTIHEFADEVRQPSGDKSDSNRHFKWVQQESGTFVSTGSFQDGLHNGNSSLQQPPTPPQLANPASTSGFNSLRPKPNPAFSFRDPETENRFPEIQSATQEPVGGTAPPRDLRTGFDLPPDSSVNWNSPRPDQPGSHQNDVANAQQSQQQPATPAGQFSNWQNKQYSVPETEHSVLDAAVAPAVWSTPGETPRLPLSSGVNPMSMQAATLPAGGINRNDLMQNSNVSSARVVLDQLDEISQVIPMPGMPLTLEEALFQTPTGSRATMLPVYWQLWQDRALLVAAQNRLESVKYLAANGRVADQAAMQQALQNCETETVSLEMSLARSQATLRQFFPGLSFDEYRPVVVAHPVTGGYDTQYQWYQENGQGEPGLEALDQTLPGIRDLMEQRANNTAFVERELEQALQATSEGKMMIADLADVMDRHGSTLAGFLNAVKQYNSTIGEYAIGLKTESCATHELALMMIPVRRMPTVNINTMGERMADTRLGDVYQNQIPQTNGSSGNRGLNTSEAVQAGFQGLSPQPERFGQLPQEDVGRFQPEGNFQNDGAESPPNASPTMNFSGQPQSSSRRPDTGYYNSFPTQNNGTSVPGQIGYQNPNAGTGSTNGFQPPPVQSFGNGGN